MDSIPDRATLFPQLLLQAAQTGLSTQNAIYLTIIILVLLLLTAITAGAETAYFSLKAKDVNYLKSSPKATYRQVIHLLEQPKMLLATILVANNFVNIAIVITTSMLVKTALIAMGIPDDGVSAFLIQIIAVTFLLVLFGEVLPKVYATQNNLRMALFSAPILRFLMRIFRPVSKVLVSSTVFIEKRLGGKNTSSLSNEDFEHAIEITVGHTATKEEVNIFKGILKFSNITVKQIMRTRLDIAAIPYEMHFSRVQKLAIEVGYSRMPVYKEDLDHIAGMIHTKDFLPHADDDNTDWHKLIRPAFFVHEGKFIEDLLKEFQQQRIHLAIVVDEFGGTSGMVTLEDIMEEIIGDIKDEFDEDDVQFRKLDDKTYSFEGKTLLNDVCRVIGLPSDTFETVRGESDSVAGLLLEISGKFPQVNDSITWENFDFTVLEIEKMRIQRVKIVINEPEEESEE